MQGLMHVQNLNRIVSRPRCSERQHPHSTTNCSHLTLCCRETFRRTPKLGTACAVGIGNQRLWGIWVTTIPTSILLHSNDHPNYYCKFNFIVVNTFIHRLLYYWNMNVLLIPYENFVPVYSYLTSERGRNYSSLWTA